MHKSLRVLGRTRLSVDTDESTSIERQREAIQQWAAAGGHTVVGWAEDISVSGSVDPFDTPQLGEWLNHRAPEWDVLCAWKLDRLGRNAIQLSRLFGWSQDHDKSVVSCSESIDLGTWAGRMLAGVIAGLAEGELEAIRERGRSSRAKLRQTARWPGGKPPYGYRSIPNPDGPGRVLEIDPEAHRVVRRIVDTVVDGGSITRLATELNAEGVLAPADYHRSAQGKPGPFTGKWHVSPMRQMLRNKALRGFAHHHGETVRDEHGNPVQLAEPLVDLDEWELIQAHLDRIQQSRKGTRRFMNSPLTGVVVCLRCEEPMFHDRNTVKREAKAYGGKKASQDDSGKISYEYRYYRCRSCNGMIPAEDLETLAEESFLAEVGELEVRERVWVPGDSHEAELREAVTALDELTAAAGRMTSATAKQRLQRQLDSLDARIAELEQAPKREARWEYRPTGQTYRHVWESLGSDVDARRELLVRSGITLAAKIDVEGGNRSKSNLGAFTAEIRVPEEIRQRLD